MDRERLPQEEIAVSIVEKRYGKMEDCYRKRSQSLLRGQMER